MSIEVLSVRGLRPECGKVDRDLWLWFCEAKKDSENYHGPRVTKRLVQAKAKEAFQAAGIHNFKASDGWYIRWLKRWHRIGIDNAKRLVTKDGPSKHTRDAHLQKKQNPQRPRTNTTIATHPHRPSQLTIDGNVSEGSSTLSSVELPISTRARVDNFSAQTSSNIFKEAEDVQQNFSRNVLAPISASSHCDIVNQLQSLHEDASYPFMSKNFTRQKEIYAIQPVQNETPFTPENSSVPNLDEVMWNNISSFDRHEPPNSAAERYENESDNGRYSSGDLSQMFTFPQLCHFNVKEQKLPIKAGAKLLQFPKFPVTNELNCVPVAVPKLAVTSKAKYTVLKNSIQQVCLDSRPTDRRNSYSDGQSFEGTVNLPSVKKVKVGSGNAVLSNITPLRQPLNTDGDIVDINLNDQQLADKVDGLNYSDGKSAQHILAEVTSNVCVDLDPDSKSFRKENSHAEIRSNDVMRTKNFTMNLVVGEPMVICNRDDLMLEDAGNGSEENFADLINVESVNNCTESMCRNFAREIVQHDLEDVSVSSDFVNQLNDEHSLELNLEYENENLSYHACPEDILSRKYKTLGSSVDNNRSGRRPAFVRHVTSDPFVDNTNVCTSAIGDGQMNIDQSEADGDFSGDENDYISEAVMLSMQEDDFSILNCDQSPFQGTISVIDEDSQPECENITDLHKTGKESMDVTSASEENSYNDSQIVFPPCSAIKETVVGQGERTFSSTNCEDNIAVFVDNRNSRSGLHTLQDVNVNGTSVMYQPCGGKSSSECHKYFVSSHLIDGKISDDLQNVAFPSFSVEERILSDSSRVLLSSPGKRREMLQKTQNIISSPIDTLSGFQISSPLDGTSTVKGQEEVCLSSSVDSDFVAHGQDMLHVSSSMDEVASVGPQDLFKISSADDQDVFMTACRYDPVDINLSQSRHSQENQQHILLSEGTVNKKTEEISDFYLLPFSTEKDGNSEITTHFAISNFILDNNLSAEDSMELSINSQLESDPRVTIANADSTTFLVPQPTCDLSNPTVRRLLSLSSPNTYVFKSTSLLASHSPPQITNCEEGAIVSLQTTLPSSGCSESLLQLETSVHSESSSNPMSCESTKENGYIAYDREHVENVQSHQMNVPRNQPKLPKKNTAYLTEKGSNTTRVVSSVQDNQTACRRSSGDRYFPYFKERVADYAIKHTAKEAARYFGVNVDTVTMWTRGRYENDSVTRNYPDQLMLRWLKKNRENGIVLTKEQIVEKAVQLLKTPGSWVKDKSRWFHVWASRLADENKKNQSSCNSEGQLPLDCGEKKALYPDEFKVEIVLYAEQTSKNLASSIFNIARKRVFEWSAALKVYKGEQEEHLTQIPIEDHNRPTDTKVPDLAHNQESQQASSSLPPSLLSNGAMKYKLNGKGLGRAVTNVAVDRELWDWFCEQTAKKSKPKSKEIRAKAVELFRAHNHDKIQCSHGWLKKWSMRYGIALRHEGDGDLLTWCLEQFDCNRNISHRDLLSHAHESLTGTHKSEFKASAGWLVRFCKRHRSLLSAKPTIDVEIPTILKPKVSEFRSHIQNLVHSSKISFDNVGSMDEVPLNFTAAGSGSRSRLLLRRSGLENCHATVVLSCLANGELLPPAVIFKGEGATEEVTIDGVPLLLLYQQDCCMTSSTMLQWLKFVWMRNVTSQSVLVADFFDPHCSESVKEACAAADISLSVIPAGCSYKLQPLDLAISRQFEANIYNRWTRHFSAVDQLSACKRSLYSSNTDIAKWVAEAYNNLKLTRKEAVRRSFIVTGLTATLNGADDHLLEDPSHIPFSSLFTSQS